MHGLSPAAFFPFSLSLSLSLSLLWPHACKRKEWILIDFWRSSHVNVFESNTQHGHSNHVSVPVCWRARRLLHLILAACRPTTFCAWLQERKRLSIDFETCSLPYKKKTFKGDISAWGFVFQGGVFYDKVLCQRLHCSTHWCVVLSRFFILKNLISLTHRPYGIIEMFSTIS